MLASADYAAHAELLHSRIVKLTIPLGTRRKSVVLLLPPKVSDLVVTAMLRKNNVKFMKDEHSMMKKRIGEITYALAVVVLLSTSTYAHSHHASPLFLPRRGS